MSMNPTYEYHPDGSVSVSVNRLEKTIQSTCIRCNGMRHILKKNKTVLCPKCKGTGHGKKTKLVSYDGVTWRMDIAAEKRRIQSIQNLHGARWAKKQKRTKAPVTIERKFATAAGRYAKVDVPRPVILPVEHNTSPVLGKDRGKKHHLRRNLRKQIVKEVRIMKPVHFHRCHGKRFSCSCDEPFFKRRCGGAICLRQNGDKKS